MQDCFCIAGLYIPDAVGSLRHILFSSPFLQMVHTGWSMQGLQTICRDQQRCHSLHDRLLSINLVESWGNSYLSISIGCFTVFLLVGRCKRLLQETAGWACLEIEQGCLGSDSSRSDHRVSWVKQKCREADCIDVQ